MQTQWRKYIFQKNRARQTEGFVCAVGQIPNQLGNSNAADFVGCNGFSDKIYMKKKGQKNLDANDRFSKGVTCVNYVTNHLTKIRLSTRQTKFRMN